MLEDPIEQFLHTIPDEKRLRDSRTLIKIMHEATGSKPTLWGNIVGFGKYHYKYETGREGDTVAVGFAPRKNALVLYGVVYYDQNLDEVKELGKYKLGKGCLYIQKLSDVNVAVLSAMIAKAFKLRNNAL